MTGKTIKDYYAILGISPDASLEEIRQAYRNKARTYHPDLNNGPDAEVRFREVNEAYEVLANPQQRKMYDSFTVAETQSPPPAPEPVVPTSPPPASPVANAATAAEQSPKPKRDGPPTWALLLIMIGAFIILGVVAGLLISAGQPKPGGDAVPAKLVKIPTFISPPVIPGDQTVIQENGNPVLLNAPEGLEVRGQHFDVVPVLPQQGRWPLPSENQKLGMWIHGTVINYVIGLPWQEETESLLAGLSSGEQLVLTLDNGSRLTFGSPIVQHIAIDNLTPLEQASPGVTVVLLGGDQSSRLMVQARYLPQSADFQPVYEVGGLKVDVLKTWILDEVSGGMVAFVIEYQLVNQGTQSYDVAYFEMALEDGSGRRYLPNAVVSRNGENGELTGTIEPGMVRQASVGYMIAAESPLPLLWTFRNDVNSPDSVKIAVPYEPPAQAPALPDLQIDEIFVDDSRNVIVVSGVLYNDGDAPLIVNQSNVSLTSSGGANTLQVASPFLPWTVNGGGSQEFELQFTLPQNVDSAVLDIMGFAIEIEGILP